MSSALASPWPSSSQLQSSQISYAARSASVGKPQQGHLTLERRRVLSGMQYAVTPNYQAQRRAAPLQHAGAPALVCSRRLAARGQALYANPVRCSAELGDTV